MSESGGIKRPKLKKNCAQCGKKAKLMIKFKGDSESSPLCRACGDEFKAQDGFASTSAPKDERDVAFEAFAASAFRKELEPLAACRWSMALPGAGGAALVLGVPDEADARALFEAIKRAMGDSDKPDAPLDAPLDELFAAVLDVVLADEDALYDELYCQLMRQLSHNPNAMSRRRGWLLFDVCSGVVAPRGAATTAAVLEFVRRSPWRSSAPHTLHRLRQLSARAAAAGADRLQARKHARTLGPSQPECDAARNNALVPVDVYLAGERAVRVFVEPYASRRGARRDVGGGAAARRVGRLAAVPGRAAGGDRRRVEERGARRHVRRAARRRAGADRRRAAAHAAGGRRAREAGDRRGAQEPRERQRQRRRGAGGGRRRRRAGCLPVADAARLLRAVGAASHAARVAQRAAARVVPGHRPRDAQVSALVAV